MLSYVYKIPTDQKTYKIPQSRETWFEAIVVVRLNYSSAGPLPALYVLPHVTTDVTLYVLGRPSGKLSLE